MLNFFFVVNLLIFFLEEKIKVNPMQRQVVTSGPAKRRKRCDRSNRVGREMDLVQLHATMVKNISKIKIKKYECEKNLLIATIDELLRKKKKLSSLLTKDSKKSIMPDLCKTSGDIKLQRKKLAMVEKNICQDHLTDYLLESIPILNVYHRVNADIKFEENEEKLENLKMEKETLVDKYVRDFFPSLQAKRDARHQNNAKKRMRKCIDELSKSSCCQATIIQNYDTSLACSECGLVKSTQEIMISAPQRNLSYSRNAIPTKSYSYRRVNHLREWMRCYTGRTLVNLSDNDFDKIQCEVKKQTIPTHKINGDFVRRLLKKLKLNTHYEQATAIAKKLNPKLKTLNIETEYEETLVLQFVTIEKPFEHIRAKVDKGRKNFLSYAYVFYRLNQRNERTELNRDVRLLKSVKLIIKQDAFWKLICSQLNWKYQGNSITL